MSNYEKTFEVMAAFDATYGFTPDSIFCLVTGKRIGSLDTEELASLIESLTDDVEEIVDDLAMRLFASMRPSMRWNKMRTDSLDEMRKQVPHETLAYLLNRLFAPVDKRISYVVEHGERIKVYNFLAKFAADETLNQAIHLLLEIDARVGLQQLAPKFTAESMIKSCKSSEALVAFLTPWHAECLAKYEKSLAESAYLTANPLAKTAFFRSFMESKPASPAMVRKAERNSEARFFEAIFDELHGTKSSMDFAIPKNHVTTKPLEPVALPTTKIPMAWLKKAQA